MARKQDGRRKARGKSDHRESETGKCPGCFYSMSASRFALV